MPQNIHINDVKSLKLKCIYDEFYDFMLYKGQCLSPVKLSDCLATELGPQNITYDKFGKYVLRATRKWDGANVGDITLKDIGLTGVDNGFISYDKETITNEEFLQLFTGSTLTFTTGDTEFFMTQVTGNTGHYDYPMEVNDEYFAFKGGFFQGFFKLDGFQYQTLPLRVEDEWNMVFRIRPRSDYEVGFKNLNRTHEGNDGIFFFIGTRAENKFWEKYQTTKEFDETMRPPSFQNDGYLDTECEDGDLYLGCCTEYPPCNEGDVCINDDTVTGTTEGYGFSEEGLQIIKTDNKFITFNRTETGFMASTYDPETQSATTITYTKFADDVNLFLLMDRTESGYTVSNIDEYLSTEGAPIYDTVGDVVNNAMGFRIKNDGSIGYRALIVDCNNEFRYGTVEEYSKPGSIKYDEWNTVVVKMKITPGRNLECDNRPRKMKLFFYVNGNLVFVSKEIREPIFSALNDISEKQEGVPYNISLGGGTQGLADVVWPDFDTWTCYRLPMEENFGGTFMGDISSFSFAPCTIGIEGIRELENNS